MQLECLNIAVFGVDKIKRTGMGLFQWGNYEVFYSGNVKLRKTGVALILRQGVTDRGYDVSFDQIIAIRLLGNL